MDRRVAGAALLALLGAGACNPDDVVHRVGWFADMRHQRNVKPYALPIPPVPGTVPVTGDEPDSLSAAQAERLVNPRSRTSESITRGQWVYATYCAVCHGDAGRGDGPIAAAPTGPCARPGGCLPGVRSLVTDAARGWSDGYVYGVVINPGAMGRGLMPRYADKIRGTDRWDVVNYVRTLQARARTGGTP